MRTGFHLAVVLVVFVTAASSQTRATDTTIIFQPARPDLITTSSYEPLVNAWGFDIMLSNNGFGAGGFFRREFSDELSGIITLAISDVKDETEVEYFDVYGNPFVPNKKNRLLMIPLMFATQYRLFRDDIVDNFRPYIMAGIGPTMMFVAPYAYTKVFFGPNGERLTFTEEVDFFKSLGKGQAKYTIGGYLGAGAYFGSTQGTLTGLSIRYYIVPFFQGIEIMENVMVKNFGGFYITLNFGAYN